MRVVITGAAGFIGRHLCEALRRNSAVEQVIEITRASTTQDLDAAVASADAIFHLAGVNRPEDPAEFDRGNRALTEQICAAASAGGRRPLLVLSSSIQAALDNPYGRSKAAAEEIVRNWVGTSGARAVVFRLKNVFGKWCRPNYNSVAATFCHNVAHDLPITISDPFRQIELIYIDDVIEALTSCLATPPQQGCEERSVEPAYRISLGDLAARIQAFRSSRESLLLPSFEEPLNKRLYATYLSYLEPANFGYGLVKREDPRGSLAEFMKSAQFGQIFVSRTNPGITRGNHFHHTKTEKFLVLEGQAVVRFRPILGGNVIEHRVDGRDYRVIDIPPGYTHSIENVGSGELVTLFWASEIFDPQRPDTAMLPVLPA